MVTFPSGKEEIKYSAQNIKETLSRKNMEGRYVSGLEL